MGAMNEPKDVSVSKLRDYLSVYHAEYNTDNRPHVLKTALDRAVAKGWIIQISGKGFSGTYRLCHPYYPSPRKTAEASPKKKAKASPAKKPAANKKAAAKPIVAKKSKPTKAKARKGASRGKK